MAVVQVRLYRMQIKKAEVSIESLLANKTDFVQYPSAYCDENLVVKLDENSNEVLVAVCSEDCEELLQSLRHFHKKSVNAVLIDRMELKSFVGRMQGTGADSASTNEHGSQDAHLVDQMADDAPIVNFVNSIFLDAIRSRASDIHVECFAEQASVRYRVDGVLVTAVKFPRDKFQSVSTRIKIMANLNIMEKRMPQDGRVSINIENEKLDIRVSIVPIADGESIVLRLFNSRASVYDLAQLARMNQGAVDSMEQMLKYPHGLILVTGPTGSGKTTTLNAMLRRIQSDTLKIITIEDPIENINDGIDQIQTNEQIGLTFDTLLRRVLRQDPNVIMVGEVRDQVTAELVVKAALTGHLVLTTLHTNDSISAVVRLKNIGVEPYLIAGTLRGVIAQRLVRKLCPKCKKTDTPKAAEYAVAKKHNLELNSVCRPVGCPECKNTGYSGRLAVFEYFLVDEGLEELIVNEASHPELLAYLSKKGLSSLAKDGARLLVSGETTLEELERETEI